VIGTDGFIDRGGTCCIEQAIVEAARKAVHAVTLARDRCRVIRRIARG
jgi:hypothetical protein